VKRRLFFGPGSVIAIIAAYFIISRGWLGLPKNQNYMVTGKGAYVVDSRDIVHPVNSSASSMSAPTIPLFKPEPESIINHALKLNLSKMQSIQIQRICAAWQEDKSSLEREMAVPLSAMDSSSDTISGKNSASMPVIQQHLSDYSELSRLYDIRRQMYWDRAYSELSSLQKKILNMMISSDRRMQK
jgi:hypothetical protein